MHARRSSRNIEGDDADPSNWSTSPLSPLLRLAAQSPPRQSLWMRWKEHRAWVRPSATQARGISVILVAVVMIVACVKALDSIAQYDQRRAGNASFLYQHRLVVVTGTDQASLDAVSQSLLLVGNGYSSLEIPAEHLANVVERVNGVDYPLGALSQDVRRPIRALVAGMDDSQVVVSEHAAYILPFIRKAFPDFTLVHLVRDGPDAASAATTRQAEQGWSPWKLVKPVVTPGEGELETKLAASRNWLVVNLGLRAWGLKMGQGSYQQFRAEDLCDVSVSRHLAHHMFEALSSPAKLELALPEHFGLCTVQNQSSAISELAGSSVSALTSIAPALFGYPSPPVTPTPTSSLEAQLAHLVMPSTPLTLVTTSESYLSTFLNWLIFYSAIQEPMPSLVIATPSEEMHRLLLDRHLPSIYVPLLGSSTGDYWRWRLSLLHEIVELGHPVVLSDSDAVWLRNPWTLVEAHSDVDLIGSRGMSRTMRAGDDKKTASFCMGWAYFSASEASRFLLRQARYAIDRVALPDDQRIVNGLLAGMLQTVWDENSEAMASQWSFGASPLLDFKTALVPQSEILRDCGPQNADLVGKATVLHCLTEKNGVDKQAKFEELGMWRLKEGWEAWWDGLVTHGEDEGDWLQRIRVSK